MQPAILTPDQRVRVFVSSTMEELADERAAVRRAVESLHLSPVLFELGARAHPPRSLYRSYIDQSHVFVGIYWQRYGWVAPGMEMSGLEDEYVLARDKPKLVYVKRPAPEREQRLNGLLERIRAGDEVSYKAFASTDELERLVTDDLALLLSEAFMVQRKPDHDRRPRLTLPADATTFVGRAGEIAELRALLERDDVRLVMLTGPGGIGKTRLALRVAADMAPAFDEGAAFVSLTALRDARLVPAAVATAVGLRDLSPESAIDALKGDLADRSLLLVVDNLEHILVGAHFLPELLAIAPRVKVLATSREALRVRAEHEFPVPPLAAGDGVRLFAERAAAVHGVRVDERNAPTVETISRRLEGVPLAIELAAAQSRLLPPETILERLEHRLEFLVGGARDLPERQRALRCTIHWSYDLLEDDERRLLAWLGVFAGSFSLGAVEAVYARDERGVLDLLASLVDKSLLRAVPNAGEPRFRMLEMIREFAHERLDEHGDAADAGERHARFYRDVGLAVGAGFRGPDQRRWLRIVGAREGDGDNLRAALAWFLDKGRLDEFADMAWALWGPAWILGLLDEGRHLAHAALAAEGDASPRSRARLLVIAGMFDMWKGDERASTALDEALAVGRALSDDEIVALATLAGSMIAGPAEGEQRAEELAEECLSLYRQLGDRWGEAAALNVLGWLYVAQERFEGARELYEETLASAETVGDEHFIALAEVNLAEYFLHEGHMDAAAAVLTSSVARHRSSRLMYSVAYLLDAVARFVLRAGDPARAAQLLGAASELRDRIGISVWGSQLRRRRRLLEDVRTALGHQAFEDALAHGAELNYADALDVAEASH